MPPHSAPASHTPPKADRIEPWFVRTSTGTAQIIRTIESADGKEREEVLELPEWRNRINAYPALLSALREIERLTGIAINWGHHSEPDKARIGIKNYQRLAREAIAAATGGGK